MAKRRSRKRTTKRKTTKRRMKRRKSSKKRVSKRRLAGFTKTGKKFALVFKKGRKLSLGKGRFSSKKTLLAAAQRFAK